MGPASDQVSRLDCTERESEEPRSQVRCCVAIEKSSRIEQWWEALAGRKKPGHLNGRGMKSVDGTGAIVPNTGISQEGVHTVDRFTLQQLLLRPK